MVRSKPIEKFSIEREKHKGEDIYLRHYGDLCRWVIDMCTVAHRRGCCVIRLVNIDYIHLRIDVVDTDSIRLIGIRREKIFFILLFHRI